MPLEVPRGVPRAEQESVIRWDESAKVVTIETASPVVVRRLAKLGLTPTRVRRAASGALRGAVFELPLARFRWGLKAKRPELSDAERSRRRELLLRLRAPEKLTGAGAVR